MISARLANKEKAGTLKQKLTDVPSDISVSQPQASELLNISRQTTPSARKVLEQGIPERITAIDHTEVAASATAKEVELPTEKRSEFIQAMGLKKKKECVPSSVKRQINYKKEEVQVGCVQDLSLSESVSLFHGNAGDLFFLENEFVDIIITSPPYNMGNEKPISRNNEKGVGFRVGIVYEDYNDNFPWDEYEARQTAALKELYRVAKPGASLFYNHKCRTLGGKLIHPTRWIDPCNNPDNPWILRQEIIWNRKSTHNNPPQLFRPIDERIYWLTKGAPILPDQSIGIPTVWESHGPVSDTWHPAPFTPELPRMLLTALRVPPSSVVLDPFAGSCTTIKVALEFKCKAIGIDSARCYLERACKANGWPETFIKEKANG